MSNISIEQSKVVVSGANRGIGKAIVEAFVKHGAAKVYAAVRRLESADALCEQFGEKVVAIKADLQEPESLVQLATEASDANIVINNAGILRCAKPLDKNALITLKEELDVNVYGLLRIAQAFAPVLKNNGGGAFVQLNSVASLKSFPDFSTYCASKAAAYSLTQALRTELLEQQTHVLSVHPGPIETDMGKEAGFEGHGEPPSVVAEGIVSSLKSGAFHLFPDSMAKEMGEAYESFANSVIEG